MTRHRANLGTSATNLTHMPPADLAPAPIAKAIAELTRIKAEHNQAASEAANYRARRLELENNARRADGQAAAEAARSGGDSTSTAHLDALVTNREATFQREAALRDAVELVTNDLHTAKSDYVATGEATKAAAAARAKLTKAASAMQAALNEAMHATALAEWLEGHPYDPRPLLPLTALAPNLDNVLGDRLHDVPPADASRALAAIAAITEPSSAHVG